MDKATREATIQAVTTRDDADLIVYWGDLGRPQDDELLKVLRARRLRRNCILWLITRGGDANVAYRIARTLQRVYHTREKDETKKGVFNLFVSSICKSAGTILASGADKLLMSDEAELGPIDIQLRKPDEVGERTSGLTPVQALGGLETHSISLFKKYFGVLRFDDALSFSTKMAAEIATNITTGMFTSLYSQIDPIRLAEVERMLKISGEYVARIGKSNLKPGGMERLLGGYPSHGFVIDRLEATEIFRQVEESPEELNRLARYWEPFSSDVVDNAGPLVFIMSAEPPVPAADAAQANPIAAAQEGA